MTPIRIILISAACVLSTAWVARADQPAIGSLDVADGVHIAGWASDPDFAGPIMVHIYVDGQMTQRLLANSVRADVGAHAFDWTHKPFGAGAHQVEVFAIDVDASGTPTGNNPPLPGSPKTFNIGCQGLVESELEWCTDNPAYWVNRQHNTLFVQNENIRMGMDSSLGGTITQLYGADWTNNLIEQHGGAGVQLSMWGDEVKGGVAYFYENFSPGECDPVPYPTQSACQAVHPPASPASPTCILRADPTGAQVDNCTTVKPCGVSQDAGLAFNPIQAQGPSCSWINPIAAPTVTPDLSHWSGTLSSLNNFTKTSSFQGMTIHQDVQLGDAYAQVSYDVTYNGPYIMRPTSQEMPAFFTAAGLSDHAYFYTGPAYANPTSAATQMALDPLKTMNLLLPPEQSRSADEIFDSTLSESWWGLCNATDTQCVTIAAFDPIFQSGLVSRPEGGGSGYLAPIGIFNLYPGAHYHFSLFVFPYKYDALVAGKSIRQRIFELHSSYVSASPVAPPEITSSLAPITAIAGDPFSYQLTASHSPLNYTLSDLPPGLAYNPANQLVTGTPSTNGVYQIKVSATNGSGSTLQFISMTVITCTPNFRQACSSPANSCGQINQGAFQCDGSCSVTIPANPPKYGNACTSAANACGLTNSGTVGCDGVTCSAAAPANPPNYGTACTSAANTCGHTNSGTIECDGVTCSAAPPGNPGTACTSAPNTCGQTTTGLFDCSGTCSGATPPNPPTYGTPCVSAPNACGQTTAGTRLCTGLCSEAPPPNSSCSAVALAGPNSIRVRVHPNPFRAVRGDQNITFDEMPANSTVQIYTVSGRSVKTLASPSGSISWDLTNHSGERVASGLYLYLVTDDQGNKTRGKFSVIK